MKTFPDWKGHPYYPISQFYQKQFGEKVYKVSVSIAESCPNRMELKGMQTCIFCDEWGSAAYHLEREHPLEVQIRINREKIAKRYRAKKFLVYFQSYTNTFDRVSSLKERFFIALAADDISGIVLGTRPDCLPGGIFPLIQEVQKEAFISVELGVQSFFNDQLEFLRRGHTKEQSIKAIERLHEKTQVDLGIHLMFGLPGETEEHILETAEIVNSLPISNVKLHNLHVLTKTPLADSYEKKEFFPIELEEYAERVALFLRHLSPHIAVQRLTAVASRWDELVAPLWTKERMRPAQFIEDRMRSRNEYQGMNFEKKVG